MTNKPKLGVCSYIVVAVASTSLCALLSVDCQPGNSNMLFYQPCAGRAFRWTPRAFRWTPISRVKQESVRKPSETEETAISRERQRTGNDAFLSRERTENDAFLGAMDEGSEEKDRIMALELEKLREAAEVEEEQRAHVMKQIPYSFPQGVMHIVYFFHAFFGPSYFVPYFPLRADQVKSMVEAEASYHHGVFGCKEVPGFVLWCPQNDWCSHHELKTTVLPALKQLGVEVLSQPCGEGPNPSDFGFRHAGAEDEITKQKLWNEENTVTE